MKTLAVVTGLALAVGAASADAQTPTQAADGGAGSTWSWEAAMGPVLLFPTESLDRITGLELFASRYWGRAPVRTGVELSVARLLGEDVGRITLGAIERRTVLDPLDLTTHLGVGAFWFQDRGFSFPGSAPCHPELGCPPGGSLATETIVLPLAYLGAGLGLPVTDRVWLRGGGRATLVRGQDGLVTLLELPAALVVRF